MRDVTMAQFLILAMRGRGRMSNQSIYREAKDVCHKYSRELPTNWEAEIRQTLQTHCPGRPRWNRRDDFFVWHGHGCWSCKESPSAH
jgi:hypothetical protein